MQTPWHKVRLATILRLTLHVPVARQWNWDGRSDAGHLVLKTPRGHRLEFKLHRGCWIRLVAKAK
jgi:hypothetical protein